MARYDEGFLLPDRLPLKMMPRINTTPFTDAQRKRLHPKKVKRLAQGELIGSGLIEGACKQLIGWRMKQTGARWTVPNANRMAELCSLTYSDQWNEYWLTI